MARLMLRVSEDPKTGLPRLDGQGPNLSEADLAVLRREIGLQFERLTSGPDNQILALNGSDRPGLPRHFRVTVIEREKRCPTLLLEATDPPPEVVPVPTASENPLPEPLPALSGRWQTQFVVEAAELVAGLTEDGKHSHLGFVVADLRALLRKDPHRFMLLLFAGYLHIGDTLSRRNGEPGDNPYARAAWTLMERAGASLPEGALDPLLPQPETEAPEPASVPPDEPVSWLREFFSF